MEKTFRPYKLPPFFGESKDDIWPKNGQWPLQEQSSSITDIPPKMVTAAREEMLREIPHFIPLLWVLIGILVPIVGLVVAVFSVS